MRISDWSSDVCSSDLLAPEREALLHGQQDLADAEQADDRDEKVEAAQQLVPAEGHAELARRWILPDGSQREAEHHRRNRLHGRFLAQDRKSTRLNSSH